jgi:hypothetical protein
VSATGRGTVRNEADFYPTPEWCTRRIVEACDDLQHGGLWLEPAVGGRAILRGVEAACANGFERPSWWTNDLYRHDAPAGPRQFERDFLKDQAFAPNPNVLGTSSCCSEVPEGWDVIITNPPYSLALEFIERALPLADVVVMLLRLNFLGGAKRAAFFRDNPPDIYVLPNRPSFTGHGTDACEYAWFVWPDARHRRYGRLQVLLETPKEER